MNYDVLDCDLDGTLVTTARTYILDVIGRTLAKLGILNGDRKDILRIWFSADRDGAIIKRLLGINDTEIFWREFRKQDDPNMRLEHTTPYGDHDFLAHARRYGIKTGVITSAPPWISIPEVRLLGRNCIDYLVSAHVDNGLRFKPDPQGLEICLERQGVTDKSRVLYGGDAAIDIETANNVGVDSFLIWRHYPNGQRYNGPKPTYEIHTLYDLASILGIPLNHELPAPIGQLTTGILTRDRTKVLVEDLLTVAENPKFPSDYRQLLFLQMVALKREYELQSGERFNL